MPFSVFYYNLCWYCLEYDEIYTSCVRLTLTCVCDDYGTLSREISPNFPLQMVNVYRGGPVLCMLQVSRPKLVTMLKNIVTGNYSCDSKFLGPNQSKIQVLNSAPRFSSCGCHTRSVRPSLPRRTVCQCWSSSPDLPANHLW